MEIISWNVGRPFQVRNTQASGSGSSKLHKLKCPNENDNRTNLISIHFESHRFRIGELIFSSKLSYFFHSNWFKNMNHFGWAKKKKNLIERFWFRFLFVWNSIENWIIPSMQICWKSKPMANTPLEWNREAKMNACYVLHGHNLFHILATRSIINILDKFQRNRRKNKQLAHSE